MLQSRRLLQGLIKQREIELSCAISTSQYQSSNLMKTAIGQSKYRTLTQFHVV